jgi:hypothetical protein
MGSTVAYLEPHGVPVRLHSTVRRLMIEGACQSKARGTIIFRLSKAYAFCRVRALLASCRSCWGDRAACDCAATFEGASRLTTNGFGMAKPILFRCLLLSRDQEFVAILRVANPGRCTAVTRPRRSRFRILIFWRQGGFRTFRFCARTALTAAENIINRQTMLGNLSSNVLYDVVEFLLAGFFRLT